MRVDLHVHTSPKSSCSVLQPEEAVREAATKVSYLGLAFKFIRAAHYGGMYNDIGPRSLGYPGGNFGYIDDPDFSFGGPVCDEQTPEGNMP